MAATSPDKGCWGQKGIGISEGVAVSHKAPLCKGGCQPKADWGIVFIRKLWLKC